MDFLLDVASESYLESVIPLGVMPAVRALKCRFPDLRLVERRRFVMVAPLADMVFDETKETTIRYEPGSVEYPSSDVLPVYSTRPGADCKQAVGAVRITSIAYKAFGDLDEDDARRDGFASKRDLVAALTCFYGDIGPREVVAIYAIRPERGCERQTSRPPLAERACA